MLDFNQEKLLEYFPSIKIKEEKIDSMNSKEIVEKIVLTYHPAEN